MKMNENGKFGVSQDLPQISWSKNRIQPPRRFTLGLRPHRDILLQIFCDGVPQFVTSWLISPVLGILRAHFESKCFHRITKLKARHMFTFWCPKARWPGRLCYVFKSVEISLGELERKNWSSTGLHQQLVEGRLLLGWPQKRNMLWETYDA